MYLLLSIIYETCGFFFQYAGRHIDGKNAYNFQREVRHK